MILTGEHFTGKNHPVAIKSNNKPRKIFVGSTAGESHRSPGSQMDDGFVILRDKPSLPHHVYGQAHNDYSWINGRLPGALT